MLICRSLAHKNWLARLAITAMCVKHGLKPIILPEDPCKYSRSMTFQFLDLLDYKAVLVGY